MNLVGLAAVSFAACNSVRVLAYFSADRAPCARPGRRQGCLLSDLGRLRRGKPIHGRVRARRRRRPEDGRGLWHQSCFLLGNRSSDLLEARRCSV
jgi:hypothetical protein